MEFITKSHLDTTTQLTISPNTGTFEDIFRTDKRLQFISEGASTDASTASITINFDSTLNVTRIALIEHNWQDFTIFYNGATANTFAMTSTAVTTASDFSTNSETSLYLRINSQACTSVTFDITQTIVANQEKAVGKIFVSDTHFVFGRDPSAKNYKPKLSPRQLTHQMSDGGVRMHNFGDKWSADIKFKFIDTDFRNNLKSLYDINDHFIFTPFGTSGSWDGVIFESIWAGPFDFYTYSDNASTAGFSGTIKLRETTV